MERVRCWESVTRSGNALLGEAGRFASVMVPRRVCPLKHSAGLTCAAAWQRSAEAMPLFQMRQRGGYKVCLQFWCCKNGAQLPTRLQAGRGNSRSRCGGPPLR